MLNTDSRFCNINFNGGNLSSDGGAILLLEYLEKIHLKDLLLQIPFFEDRTSPVFTNHELAYQMIVRNLLGYFNQSDHKYLGLDPLINEYYTSCSQPTASRFFSRACRLATAELKELITREACKYVNENVEDVIIDSDSTIIGTKGNQEASAYISHYNAVGYHPLVVTECNSKLLLSSMLRTGSAYSSNGIIGEMETVMSYLNNNGHIRFRGDSAFYDSDLLAYFEGIAITYYIRAKGFKALKRAASEDLASKDEFLSEKYDYAHPYYGETQYTIGKSSIARRIVYKAYWVEEDGQLRLLPEIYAIVTNDTDSTPEEAMKFYEKRGTTENFNKEFKGDFHAGTLSHQKFLENELEFLLCSLSYNVFHMFQNTVLIGEDKKLTMNKFRLLFQKIAVRVSHHARKVNLAFSSAYSSQKRFLQYWNMVLQL